MTEPSGDPAPGAPSHIHTPPPPPYATVASPQAATDAPPPQHPPPPPTSSQYPLPGYPPPGVPNATYPVYPTAPLPVPPPGYIPPPPGGVPGAHAVEVPPPVGVPVPAQMLGPLPGGAPLALQSPYLPPVGTRVRVVKEKGCVSVFIPGAGWELKGAGAEMIMAVVLFAVGAIFPVLGMIYRQAIVALFCIPFVLLAFFLVALSIRTATYTEELTLTNGEFLLTKDWLGWRSVVGAPVDSITSVFIRFTRQYTPEDDFGIRSEMRPRSNIVIQMALREYVFGDFLTTHEQEYIVSELAALKLPAQAAQWRN